jgi:sigma-B regulation protein RsbU (phosphoserine phosphatase)
MEGAVAKDSILLLGSADPKLPDWCALLRGLGYEVRLSPTRASHLADLARGGYDLVLFDVEGAPQEGVEFCRELKAAMGHNFIPLILITPAGDVASKARGLELSADDTLVKPVDPEELSARVVSLLRIKHLHDELRTKNLELERVHGALRNAYETIQADLQLAERLQRSLLPRQMPDIAGIRFAARYLASGTVGGDFYDAFRLDERHVGFYVADAVGHGVRAALLTVFLKKGITTKEIGPRSYRLLTPAEVLERLNEDMLREQLAESPFITIVYATLNVETLELQYSCAGHPFPIVLRSEGTQQLLDKGGGLVGLFEDRFENGRCQLNPGDRLICYTDGIQSAFGPTVANFVERFQDILARLRHEELSRMLSNCEKELRRQAGHAELEDDLTLFGLDIRPRA